MKSIGTSFNSGFTNPGHANFGSHFSFFFPFPITICTGTYIKGHDICSAAVAIGQHWLNCQKQPGDCSHFTASIQL